MRTALALLAALLLPVPAWTTEDVPPHEPARAAPPDPDEAAPPDPDAARALVTGLLDRIRSDTLDEAWLAAHLRPPRLPAAPTAAHLTRWHRALTGDTRLARALREAAPVAVLPGPAYQRVLLGAAPGLSAIVVQGASGPMLAELTWTPCALCDERTRFVQALLDDVAREGRRTTRLVPGVELHVADHLARTGLGGDWIGALELRNRTGGHLALALRGARVVGREDEVVRVSYADDTEDTWAIRWIGGRWQLDYDRLAPDSPLRLPRGASRRYGERRALRSGARAAWQPSFRTRLGGAGLELGHGALDAWPDPRDGTVLVVVMDLDRVLAAAFRVDPETRTVLARIPLPPPGDRTRLPLADWTARWIAALSPDGHTLAFSAPDRIWQVDLGTRRPRQVARGPVRWLGFTPLRDRPDALLVGRSDGLWRLEGGAPVRRHRLEGTPVVAWATARGGLALTDAGAVWDLGRDEVVARVCCGAVTDGAVLPDGSGVVATCAEPCDTAVSRCSLEGEVRDLPGAGTAARGTSVSPDGAWFTTGRVHPDGAVLLWDATQARPVARIPVGPTKAVRWSVDGEHLVTIGEDGAVAWWERRALLRAAALDDAPVADPVRPRP